MGENKTGKMLLWKSLFESFEERICFFQGFISLFAEEFSNVLTHLDLCEKILRASI